MQSDQVLRSSSAYGDRLGEKVGTASLTFVFDSTGSMWDDLTHVKIGAAKILDTMLERSNKPIYNFVLVPFRDPTVGPVTVTKDHKEFKEKLQEISVLGGADCPENTFAALYEAVNISEPGSYIYVFTDARSSDYDLYSEVSTLIQRKQSQVHVGPVTVTKDHKEFKEKLQEISVLGGADCPENTFAALYEAVNISEPGSYIYVFTDARSSDYDLYSEVSTLIQRKQSQLKQKVCKHLLNKYKLLCGQELYIHKYGVVYHLNKKEVDEVLNFVRLSLNSLKVNLFSVDNPNPTVGENHGIPIDKTLKEFTVSVAGLKPLVNIYNPQGRPSDVTPLLDLDHVKIVSVKDPEPGVWTVQISSDSQHSVRSTGLSSTDFVHGFALKPTTNIRNTYHRPLKGAKNSILVQTTEDKDSTQLSSVEVTAINGTVLARLPLKPTPNNDGVYSGGPFVPYDDPCFIAITGKKYDEEHTSYPFKRISPTAFSPQNPESPRIEMASHQIEWIGSSAVLRCSVKSLVPFDVRWFKDGLVKSVNFHYEQSADVEFKIPNVTLASGGVYTCRANNIAGPASKKLRLQIKGLPPKVKAGLQKSGVSGQSVILTCSVTSSLPYNLTWLHVRSNFSSAQSRDIRNEARFITTTKNDLLISPVLPMDQGWYLCVANNSEGQSGSDKVMLTVQKKPQIKITSDTVEFKKNDDIVMSCFVLDGIPPPTLAWKKDGQFIKEETQETYFNNELDIHIIEADQSDAGVYECQASNEVGVSK
ncbi:hemicentin-1-like [Diaphorina citri]|uniref:Hemicentin-1-like n=1 Tax=Diaphorina citri TaxID=121845 RepID=A0A3Q0IX94_DIACI|nr:hemicentin-1-like [Diaphorina citri]